jgi:hypothetical protein
MTTRREAFSQPVSSVSCGTSGVATVATLQKVGDISLLYADELLISFDVETAFAGGTSPTLDVYIQQQTADGTWVDLVAFDQHTDTANGKTVVLPLRHSPPSPADAATNSLVETALTAAQARVGHWGSTIRIQEEVGGTVGTAAIYSVFIRALEDK